MDTAITQWINGFAGQNPVVDQMMIAITKFGVPAMIVFVVLQWWSRNDRLFVRHVAICAGLSFLLGLAINQGILVFVHRLRPYDLGLSNLLIDRSADWSFPSDHATASMSIAAAFVIRKLPRRAAALFAMAILIGISRVYVGTHFATDVLGGAATGIVAALAVCLIFRENSRLNRIVTRIL